LIVLAIMVLVLIWIARWTPEFAYRWLFAKTKDIGIRNSLSVFTQYTVLALGLFVALKIVGIDISGLKFVFGGLAIGIGFGLRDLANNFVSGILLLIERPLRKGDMVTIGNHEGEVTHIGMRSVTVKTWDNTEVLVPNSETFNKPFTNWTHQDSIIRTVVKIKINWSDEPKHVQEIIQQVLKEIPAIVSFPEPEVFLKEIEEALLEFEIRYFINLQFNSSRPEIRSKVLFAVWERFKQYGIHPPHPQHDVYLKKADDTSIMPIDPLTF
jgi:potassium-dependent mechanosensitive channel